MSFLDGLIGFLSLLAGTALGAVLGIWFFRRSYLRKLEESHGTAEEILRRAQQEASKIRQRAESKADHILRRARKEVDEERRQFLQEIKSIRKEIRDQERQLEKKNEALARWERDLRKKEAMLEDRERSLQAKEQELDQNIKRVTEKLEEVARMTREQARQELLKHVEMQARYEAAQLLYKIREEARQKAEQEAREMIATAIQRCAASHTAETTVTVVPIPSDDMKGRIIGREGRNIRTFENLTGVEVIIDDTPEAVALSSFDPVRREMARLALERLLQDGRIHPSRIEEVVKKVEEEFEEHLLRLGEQAVVELGISSLHPELLKLVGRMKFRTSYGQNLYYHSIEVARLAAIMAGDLHINEELVKRAGLLHDIGKVASDRLEGPHAQVGAQLAKRYGENDVVVNAIAAHHGDVPMQHPVAFLVAAADAISGSRPGARRENVEAYIKRIQKLEEIAHSFMGVEQAYAIHAGRELRIMVQADKVSDTEAFELARAIAERIENEMEYPGQIRVVVVRETRAVEYAR